MKKTIYVLLAILVIVGIALTFLTRPGEYAAEKSLYQALRGANKIVQNPDVVPPVMFAAAEGDLKNVVTKFPKTNTAKVAQMALAKFYVVTKKFDKAFEVLDTIIKVPDQNAMLSSEARFIKGNIYESRGQWSKALAEYIVLRDSDTITPIGLQMPLYIANYYRKNGDLAEATSAFNEAVAYYRPLSRKHAKTEIGYVASNFLSQSYVNLKKYEEAGLVIEDTIDTYPSMYTYRQQLPAMELIYAQALKDPRKAIAVYKRVLEKTKDARLAKLMQARIDQLSK